MINHGMEGVDNRNTISRRVEEDCDILSTLFANALNGIQKFDLASAQWTIWKEGGEISTINVRINK